MTGVQTCALPIYQLMDMLLAKKRAADRRDWLEEKGNLAEVQV